jgi:hypothetical protein
MFGAQHLLANSQSRAEKLLGFGELPLGSVELAEVIEAGGQAWVLGAEGLGLSEGGSVALLSLSVAGLVLSTPPLLERVLPGYPSGARF